jgi:hypothetical protein
MFKVLWFDDEHDKLEYLHEEAKLQDIELIGFDNAEDGLKVLENQFKLIDAVIIDGIFHLRANTVGKATTNEAFEEVVKRLYQLSDRKIIPYFILSGQITFIQNEQRLSGLLKNPKIFDKTSDEDRQALWADIIKQANSRIYTQIRTEHPELFTFCSEKYIGEGYADIFLSILKQIKEPYQELNYSYHFPELRKVIEGLFRIFARLGILHEKCVDNGKVNLLLSSHFLAGNPVNHLDIKRSEPAFSATIADSVKRIIHFTNAEVHQDKSILNENQLISKYQLYALTFELISVLTWAKEFIDQNQDIKKNKSYWSDTRQIETDDWITVKLIEINDHGWGELERDEGADNLYMPPSMISKNKLSIHQSFQIKTKIVENGKTHIEEIKTH